MGDGIPFWYDDPASWNTLTLGGVDWPGIADIKISGGQDLDVKKSKGKNGATMTYTGYSPRKLVITVKYWTPEQWKRIQQLSDDIEPKADKKKLTPLDIVHPKAKFRKIKAIVVANIDGPDETNVPGCDQIVINAYEYSKQSGKNVTSTPTASVANAVNSLPLFQLNAETNQLVLPSEDRLPGPGP